MKLAILLYFIISLCSCNNSSLPPSISREDSLSTVKWYYYSYTTNLKAYDSFSNEIDPLSCDLKFNAVDKINNDTTKYFFQMFYKDSLNICTLKPFDLQGIICIQNRLFLPIYHLIDFDNVSDSVLNKNMEKHLYVLKQKVISDKNKINNWLKFEAIKRNIIK